MPTSFSESADAIARRQQVATILGRGVVRYLRSSARICGDRLKVEAPPSLQNVEKNNEKNISNSRDPCLELVSVPWLNVSHELDSDRRVPESEKHDERES